jgi:hypothetical protein
LNYFIIIVTIRMSTGTCCLQFVRVVVIVFNVVFVLCSLALIGVGAWIYADPKVLRVVDLTVDADNSDLLRNSAILIISVGCLLFVVSLLGLVGAILLNSVLLGVHLALLIVAFCGEIAGSVLAIVFKDWMLDQLERVLRDSLAGKQYYQPTDGITCKASDVGALWDYVQVRMNCCGIYAPPRTGYETLRYSIGANCPAIGIDGFNRPLTCCAPDSDLKPVDDEDTDQTSSRDKFDCSTVKAAGCLDEIESWVEHYAPVLIGIGFGVAMLHTIGIIFVVCLCVNSNARCKKYKRQH